MSRRTLFTAVALALAIAHAPARASANDVLDTSFTLPGGEPVMEMSVVVAAPLAEVWRLYTTTEGFRSWAAPVARVDLRVGGEFEATYSAKGQLGAPDNIRNQILALVPLRLVVTRNVQAPPNTPFDAPTFQTTQTAVSFFAVDEQHTRVMLQSGGYGLGEKYAGVFKFFRAGNAWTLDQLRQKAESVPKG